MKLLIVPDLHGKSSWQNIDVLSYDKVIFLGDYVDAFTISDSEIVDNLQKLIQQKEKYPEKIALLLGNHDIQYLHYPAYQCSGYRASYQAELTDLFNNNHNLFQVAYQVEQYLFTHAGVTNSWYREFLSFPVVQSLIENISYTPAELFNKIELSSERDILHQVSHHRGGKYEHGGITWAHKSELERDHLFHHHQVVGHTAVKNVESLGVMDTSVTFIDILDSRVYFHHVDTDCAPLSRT